MTKHQHGEAYMLMRYRCDGCGHQETIWNSRDGVTPFGISCPSCGAPRLQHVDWQFDTYDPYHQLHPDQRFWRDGTDEERDEIVSRRVASALDRGMPASQAADLTAAIQNSFQRGWPVLDRRRA